MLCFVTPLAVNYSPLPSQLAQFALTYPAFVGTRVMPKLSPPDAPPVHTFLVTFLYHRRAALR